MYDKCTGFDSSYSLRHEKRNKAKISAILKNIGQGETLLDIGCNEGYASKAVLDANLYRRVTGVDLSKEVVSPSLLEDPCFDFFEGSVTVFPFDTLYNGVLYNAVHHHVFLLHGRNEAFRVWQQIIECAERFIIFESGQMRETGGWPWQAAIHKYYPNDQEHISDLLHEVGPRLKSVKKVASLPIHNINRSIIKIELFPRVRGYPIRSFHSYEPVTRNSDYDSMTCYCRTIGSKRQTLISSSASRAANMQTHEGIVFRKGYVLEISRSIFSKNI